MKTIISQKLINVLKNKIFNVISLNIFNTVEFLLNNLLNNDTSNLYFNVTIMIPLLKLYPYLKPFLPFKLKLFVILQFLFLCFL